MGGGGGERGRGRDTGRDARILGGSWLLLLLARIQMWAPGAGWGGTWETVKAAGVFRSGHLGVFYRHGTWGTLLWRVAGMFG